MLFDLQVQLQVQLQDQLQVQLQGQLRVQLLDRGQSPGANPTDSMLVHYGVKYNIIRSNVGAEMKRLQFVG